MVHLKADMKVNLI